MFKVISVLFFLILCVVAISTVIAFSGQVGGIVFGVLSVLFLLVVVFCLYR